MLGGKVAGQLGMGLAVCLAAVGCVTLGGTTSAPPVAAVPVRPRPVPPAGPELRITDNVVAQASDIPIVPVPPPPLGRTTPPAPAPATPPKVTPAPPPAPPAAPAATALSVRQIYELARDRYATIDSYIVRLTRREQVKGKDQPEEIILFKFRKNPWSLSFKWLGTVGQGREAIYVKGQHEDKIHTMLAAGDAPFMPAGKVMSLPPDSILVRNASRHAITDAGIGALLDYMGQTLAANERGDHRQGTLTALGLTKRPEFPQRLLAVEKIIPPGAETELPRGGRRITYFDPESHLPVLVTTRDDRGHEVEYYRYDRLLTPVKLNDDDFNPKNLGIKPVR